MKLYLISGKKGNWRIQKRLTSDDLLSIDWPKTEIIIEELLNPITEELQHLISFSEIPDRNSFGEMLLQCVFCKIFSCFVFKLASHLETTEK